jgi:hypothetical protein
LVIENLEQGPGGTSTEKLYSNPANPLSKPLPASGELFKRVELAGWWLKFHRGLTYEAVLRDKIVRLGTEVGFQDRWLKRILRHAISEFSKKGLGPDYYGYHNIDHELEAAYFTLVAATGPRPDHHIFTQKDIMYLFVAALFHDYDPLKRFDKPHEDAVENIVRSDRKIVRFIEEVGLNIDIVLALIHRTAYPFRGEIAEHAKERMKELFDAAGLAPDDIAARTRYANMGWFLSVAERIAGYALGDFQHAMDLARKNAHALGWHPSVINERSVQYFSSLQDEKEMFDSVMMGVPEWYRRTFYSNEEGFRKAWLEEQELRSMKSKSLRMIAVVEGNHSAEAKDLDEEVKNSVIQIHREQALPIRVEENEFRRTMSEPDTILVTLRILREDGGVRVVGYAKGYPLEKSRLRRGTTDENFGRYNTAYLEGMGVMKGFWGSSGGHLLRLKFLSEASKRGYKFVTGYAHRDVILQRAKKGESMNIVQRYDPDMLDYYRADLTDSLYQTILNECESIYIGQS